LTPAETPEISASRITMKRWFLAALILLALGGCSWQKVIKWFQDAEWERDDRTIRIIEIIPG